MKRKSRAALRGERVDRLCDLVEQLITVWRARDRALDQMTRERDRWRAHAAAAYPELMDGER